MTDAGARIPAWKRLGLALKNQTQSGVTAPEPSAAHSNQHYPAPYNASNGSHDNVQSPIEPAVNGSSSKLGKRKHQHEAAEEDAQPPKRGKKAASGLEHVPTAAIVPPAATDVDVAKSGPASSEPARATATGLSQPKGDPNYRKKKEKPAKSKRQNQEESRERSSPSPNPQLSKKGRRTLLASTETDHEEFAPISTPQQQRETSRSSTKDTSGSPSAVDRRKSVTFTPDTKRVDGHSAQNLFKKWVAEQKGEDIQSAANIDDSAPVVETPPAIKEPEQPKKSKKEKKTRDPAVNDKETKVESAPTPGTNQEKPTATTKGKKKDPSIYISYLTQYHTNRQNWKFNKAKQNDIIDNAVNIFRIPSEHSDALLEYVQGLKGAGAIELLTQNCKKALKELDEEDAKESTMDTPEARQAAENEALQTRVAKERKRRKVEGDMEALSQHAVGTSYLRRLRRERAEALLAHLGRAAEVLPAKLDNGINPLLKHVAPARDSRKRKRRTEVSSDESSSDSSSDESSSSEEDSEDDDSSSDGTDSSSSDDSDRSVKEDSSEESSSESEGNSDSDCD